MLSIWLSVTWALDDCWSEIRGVVYRKRRGGRGGNSVAGWGGIGYEKGCSRSLSCEKLQHIMLTVGSEGIYEWLVTDEDFDLLQLCPDIVHGKYVAITSIDSGEFVPSDEETAAGWRTQSRIAYSPRITQVDQVPHEVWDEWYIFNNPVDLGTSHLGENIFEVQLGPQHLAVLVNYGFALDIDRSDETLVNLFWQQMKWIQPESYVSVLIDNPLLTFVSMNKALFASVHLAVKSICLP
jgi:hypothetical protein